MIASEKSIRLQPVFIQKRFEVNKKQIFSSEKMRNSGNCIYDHAHSFSGEDFKSSALYILVITLMKMTQYFRLMKFSN